MSSIKFRLGTDNSDFKKGLRDAETDANSASGRIAGAFDKLKGLAAGVVAFAALKAGIQGAMAEASRLADLSDNLSASTDSLQAFDYIGRQNGVTMEQLQKALEGVSLKSQDLIDGNEQATASFAKLGLRAKDFIGLDTDERLAVLAKAFHESADRGNALNAVADILGAKVGPKLVSTLDEIGGRGLPGITESARQAGQVIDKDVITALDKLDDRLAASGKRGKLFFAELIDHVLTFGRVIAKGAPTVIDETAEGVSGTNARDRAQKEASRRAETERAKKAREAAKDKAAQKRDLEEKRKLDEYVRAKNSNDEEAARQALEALTPEQKRTELARQRIALEREAARLPRNQIDAETKREEIRGRILKITDAEKKNNKEIADSLEKQRDKLKEINDKLAEANRKNAEAKTDLINAQLDPFRFSLADAASGKRGSDRARGNARLIQSKEKQASAILDRNNLQFGEDGQLRYIPAEGESPEAVRSKQEITRRQTLPRLRALMSSASGLRTTTANLDRKDQDPTAQAKKAYKDALDESKRLEDIQRSLAGKFLNQGGGK